MDSGIGPLKLFLDKSLFFILEKKKKLLIIFKLL